LKNRHRFGQSLKKKLGVDSEIGFFVVVENSINNSFENIQLVRKMNFYIFKNEKIMKYTRGFL